MPRVGLAPQFFLVFLSSHLKWWVFLKQEPEQETGAILAAQLGPVILPVLTRASDQQICMIGEKYRKYELIFNLYDLIGK